MPKIVGASAMQMLRCNKGMELFNAPAEVAARDLLGCELIVTSESGEKTGGIIIETEAYAEYDEASHTFKGQTPRNAAMFGEPGTVYVYFTYGMHECMNFSVHKAGVGEGVLIRAIEPTMGIDIMWQRRFGEPKSSTADHKKLVQLTNGPAKLTQALGVIRKDNHQRVGEGKRFELRPRQLQDFAVVQTTRVGISRAADRPWRWYVAGNDWVSKK